MGPIGISGICNNKGQDDELTRSQGFDKVAAALHIPCGINREGNTKLKPTTTEGRGRERHISQGVDGSWEIALKPSVTKGRGRGVNRKGSTELTPTVTKGKGRGRPRPKPMRNAFKGGDAVLVAKPEPAYGGCGHLIQGEIAASFCPRQDADSSGSSSADSIVTIVNNFERLGI